MFTLDQQVFDELHFPNAVGTVIRIDKKLRYPIVVAFGEHVRGYTLEGCYINTQQFPVLQPQPYTLTISKSVW